MLHRIRPLLGLYNINKCKNLLLSKKQKERLVIKLAEEGKTTRDIAKEAYISLKDIGKIINRATGDSDIDIPEKDEKQKRLKSLSLYAQAFQMFKDNALLEDIAIELDIKTDTVLDFYEIIFGF